MSDDVLIPYGFRDRSLIHISEAVAGLACGCNCFGCGNPLIAKKGNIKIHHFAHAYVGQCVGRETLLHAMGKQLLQDRFEHSISSGNPLWLKWRCRACGEEHSGSFKQVRAVAVEKAIGGYTPDLTLSDHRGRPIAAIEVDVTHEPDPEAILHYADQGIMVIEFHLNDFDDLSHITDPGGLLPDKVGFCPRPSCIRCRKVLSKLFLTVIDITCPKCRKPMGVGFKELGPDGILAEQIFDEKEITKATKLGANLWERYCRVEKIKYTGNVCPGCDAFLPRSEIPKIVWKYFERSNPKPEAKQTRLGYGCPKCDVPRPQKPTAPKTEIEVPKEAPPSVTSECVAARMVDFHFQNGKKYREVYYVRAYFGAGKPTCTR
jgi:hypothetical protein